MERLIVNELKEMIRNNSIISTDYWNGSSYYGNIPIDIMRVDTANFHFSIFKLMYTSATIKYVLDFYTGGTKFIKPELSQENLKELFDLGMARYNEYFSKDTKNLKHLYEKILQAKAANQGR